LSKSISKLKADLVTGLSKLWRRVTARSSGETSVLGVLIQLLGIAGFLYGVSMVYVPAAFVLGGVLALLAGERF
jgi:hypothetical protein